MADQQHLNMLKKGVEVWNQWRKDHPEIQPDVRKVQLEEMNLVGVNFQHARLDDSTFISVSLNQAKLRHAHLNGTCFKGTTFQGANFHEALLLDTAFLNVDFRGALNLETVHHLDSSTIGVDTIERSRGCIPDSFLRKAGVSEQMLECIRAVGQTPFEYFSCFISYSSRDEHFVERLYQDLRKAGVHCWYAPASLQAGDQFRSDIAQAIQRQEKLLLVLSTHALKSKEVEREFALARQKEGGGKRKVLLPIRLDDTILKTTAAWAASIHDKRHIRSFDHWEQEKPYQKALEGLLSDLKKEQ